MNETAEVAAELQRLAGCADIPAIRRRQLLRLAEKLAPVAHEPPHGAAEPFVDPYYRRAGLRMRAPRNELGEPQKPFADTFSAMSAIAAYLAAPDLPTPNDTNTDTGEGR